MSKNVVGHGVGCGAQVARAQVVLGAREGTFRQYAGRRVEQEEALGWHIRRTTFEEAKTLVQVNRPAGDRRQPHIPPRSVIAYPFDIRLGGEPDMGT